MQDQVINPPATAQPPEVQKPTPCLKLCYAAHSDARLQELWESGEVTRGELLAELRVIRERYDSPASYEYITIAFRELVAIKPMAGRAQAEQVYVTRQFVDDLMSENVTQADIDYSFARWRKSPERFAPNQGQILEIIRNNPRPRHTVHAKRIYALLDPQHAAKPKPKLNGIKYQPKPFMHQTTAEQRKAQVERRKVPVSVKSMQGVSREHHAKASHRRKVFLASTLPRVEIIEKHHPGGRPFYAVVGFDAAGKSIPLGQHMRKADAEKFMQNVEAV